MRKIAPRARWEYLCHDNAGMLYYFCARQGDASWLSLRMTTGRLDCMVQDEEAWGAHLSGSGHSLYLSAEGHGFICLALDAPYRSSADVGLWQEFKYLAGRRSFVGRPRNRLHRLNPADYDITHIVAGAVIIRSKKLRLVQNSSLSSDNLPEERRA